MQIEIKLGEHYFTAEIDDTSVRSSWGTKVYDFELESLTAECDDLEMSDQFIRDLQDEIDAQIKKKMKLADDPY